MIQIRSKLEEVLSCVITVEGLEKAVSDDVTGLMVASLNNFGQEKVKKVRENYKCSDRYQAFSAQTEVCVLQ